MPGIEIGMIGSHPRVSVSEMRDINGRVMVTCSLCKTTAHRVKQEDAIEDLSKTACAHSCSNCESLRHSYDRKPAVPLGGTCNDILHVCPNDGNRWWQGNTYFHLWQQVTHDREWEILQEEQKGSPRVSY